MIEKNKKQTSPGVSLVIGSNLPALQYAYQNQTSIILNKLNFPYAFESRFAKQAWGLLYTKLMLDGNIIGGDSVNAIKISDDEVTTVGAGNVINKVLYETLYIFDDENVIGLSEVEKESDEYLVIDILKANSLITKKPESVIKTKDFLVNSLYIIKPNATSPIQIYSISNLNKEQLKSFDYSDTMVKFKSEHMLKKNGFIGKSGSRNKIDLEVTQRIVQKKMDIYKETNKIKYIYGSLT